MYGVSSPPREINMNMNILQLLDKSLTPYHTVAQAVEILNENGFTELKEHALWKIEPGKGYYVIRDGSALIAFKYGEKLSFTITASHTDSPCFKIKGRDLYTEGNYAKFNVEKYGGGLFYSMLDTPLKAAGRVITEKNDTLTSHVTELDQTFAIPSVAIHFNRQANDGLKINPQIDMQVLAGIINKNAQIPSVISSLENKLGEKVIDFDLFIVPATKSFSFGFNNELACAPRVDNLTSAFSSIEALIAATPSNVSMVYLADNEEVGSRTKQGAGSTFLKDVTERIAICTGVTREEYLSSLANSILISADNAHANHPNHPELSDKQNPVVLGGGLVIKHHACGNYTTDGMSSAILKHVLTKNGVSYQDFYMRSDLPCGGTLGAISSSQLSVRSVDVGMPQLAMHSAAETFALADYENAVCAYKAIFNADFSNVAYNEIKVK